MKPCTFYQYHALKVSLRCIFLDIYEFLKTIENFDDGEYGPVGFTFGFPNSFIKVKEDKWLYPIETFIAEVGGSLGLFLGFSFLGFWDIVSDTFCYCIRKNK